MPTIDHILKKMNIHGVNPRDQPSGGKDESQLTIQDVFAAGGYGDLAPRSWYFGLAVYTLDECATRQARAMGIRYIKELGERENWVFQKPYLRMVNDLVRDGRISAQDAILTKKSIADRLPGHLFNLVLDELRNNLRCAPCNGKGTLVYERISCRECNGKGHIFETIENRLMLLSEQLGIPFDVSPAINLRRTCANCSGSGSKTKFRTCGKCHGSGTATISNPEKAARTYMHYNTWYKTWRYRYRLIRSEMAAWVNEFESHLQEKC